MIAPMEKLIVAGPKRRVHELLGELQRIGVVQIDALRTEELPEYAFSSEEEDAYKRWQRVAQGAEHALVLLGVATEPSRPFEGELAAAESELEPLAHRADVLTREAEKLREEIELIDLYQQPVETLAEMAHGLDQSRWVSVLPFLLEKESDLDVATEALAEVLEDRFLLAHKPLEGKLAAIAVVLKDDEEAARAALSRKGIGELRLTGPFAGLSLSEARVRMRERAKLAPEELENVHSALVRLRKEAEGPLRALWTRAVDEVARLRALLDIAAGRFGFALFGWIPARLKGKVEEALAAHKDHVVYTLEPADEHHEADRVPVTLENGPMVKPFQMLIEFLNTPKYGTWDPTWVVAVFFPFWFGMIVGDLGYALLFVLVARLLAGLVKRNEPLVIEFFGIHMKPPVVKDLLFVLNAMIFWTVVWGFIYGEFFGNFFEHLGIFYVPGHTEGLLPVLIPRADTAKTATLLILVSIAFGIVQVFHGLGVRAWLGLRHGHMKHFWEAVGYLGGLTGLIVFSYEFLTGQANGALNLIMYLGFAVFVLAIVMSRMVLMVAELPTQGGHILSYIRIYAVGVAGAIMANLATDLGFALADKVGLIGILVGLVLALLTHLTILALTLMGHILQPIRLIWVEFFTKFGFYEESGRPYRPFKSVRNDAGSAS
ncbi:V-type ATP synthase subunit I [Oceanithermus sp.]